MATDSTANPITGTDSELCSVSPVSTLSSSLSPHSGESAHGLEMISPASSISAPRPSLDGRVRRTRGSSDDYADPESDGFVSRDSRVGGPYLCPYPATYARTPSPHPCYDFLMHPPDQGPSIDVPAILKAYNIPWRSWWVCSLQSIYSPLPSPVPTLMVNATQETPSNTWLQAARKIYNGLVKCGFTDVSVEISTPKAMLPRECSPVLPSDEIFSKWQMIYERILSTCDIREWIALECFRYGRESDRMKNPPTVIISVQRGSKVNWLPTREQVAKILNEFRLSTVGVSVVEDKIIRSSGDDGLLPAGGFQMKAQAGFSLGIEQESTTASGTLGGFVEIKCPDTGEWLIMGLTCFHCVHEHRKGNSAAESERKRKPFYDI